jgi:hypothetical protein
MLSILDLGQIGTSSPRIAEMSSRAFAAPMRAAELAAHIRPVSGEDRNQFVVRRQLHRR